MDDELSPPAQLMDGPRMDTQRFVGDRTAHTPELEERDD